jgi:predicted nucleic acid-binding protein
MTRGRRGSLTLRRRALPSPPPCRFIPALSLDTDTVIDCILGTGKTREKLFALIEADEEVALCPVTVVEVYSGMNDKRRAKWESWLLALPYWHISFDVATRAGIYRKTATESGHTLSVSDALLAALAYEHGAIPLTSNIKDYPMKDVRVLSLREETA